MSKTIPAAVALKKTLNIPAPLSAYFACKSAKSHAINAFMFNDCL